MPVPSDPEAAALLIHVVSQTRENIAFLASQNYISAADAEDMKNRLAAVHNSEPAVDGTQRTMLIGVPPSAVSLPPRRVPPPSPPTQRARALWAYNEDGQEPNDLSFSAGEIIEIVDETNADWWTGKCRGRQGLFPCNHVEKLQSASMYPIPAPIEPFSTSSMPPIPAQPVYNSAPAEKPVYRPFGAVTQATDMPPAAGVNSVGLQQAPQQEHKKSKFGKLGNTMAQSAAGGVGFGAGAAIGSGIVNAIF